MNTELLLRVKAHILAEPRRLNMSDWQQHAEPSSRIKAGFEQGKEYSNEAFVRLTKHTAPPCGTVACIAGWTILLANANPPTWLTGDIAKDLLELPNMDLFFPKDWPEPFKSLYPTLRRSRDRARLVGKVIDNFIATDRWTKEVSK